MSEEDRTGECEVSLCRKREAGCARPREQQGGVLEAGKPLISVTSQVAHGAELEGPRAGWAHEERGKI